MNISDIKNAAWVSKYSPNGVSDCILPDRLKNLFLDFVKQGDIPHLLLSGSAGTGKTTVARALCNDIGAEYLFINASEQNGIGVLRTTVKGYAATVSLTGTKKVIILDEADNLSRDMQSALRGVMEEYIDNCRFILTCNYKNKLIEPLHSRCTSVDFTLKDSERLASMKQFMQACVNILKNENVKFDVKVVAEFIKKHFPDNRKVLNELQSYSASGTIDSGILTDVVQTNVNDLIAILKEKDFVKMRQWVNSNLTVDHEILFRTIYDNLNDHLSADSVPEIIVLINDYLYKSKVVVDQEINMVAFLTMLMATAEFS